MVGLEREKRLAEEDWPSFRGLGIRAVYDLRTGAEQAEWPDRLPPGVANHRLPLDVTAPSTTLAPPLMRFIVMEVAPGVW